MYVVHEKAFLYSIILSLEIPTKENLVKVLKKEHLKYDLKSLDETLDKIKDQDGAHARTIMLMDPGISLITFYRWEGDALDYGCIAHELFHAVDMNLRSKGIILSDHSDEVYAHHIGYFTREFFNRIWKDGK